MKKFGLVLLTFIACDMTLIDQSEAMYGLCSTDWMSDSACLDNNDECKQVCYSLTGSGHKKYLRPVMYHLID